MELEEKLKSNSWLVTNDTYWWEKWDRLQRDSTLGMFTQTSSWLNSYHPYGFSVELLLNIAQDGNILCGFASLVVKAGPFIAYVCPWGPYLTDQVELESALSRYIQRGKELKAFAVQINPTGAILSDSRGKWLKKAGFQKGGLINKIYTPIDFNLIHLPNSLEVGYEKLLMKSFSENARRNIKAGLKNELVLKSVETERDTEKAYRCFEENAAREGYAVRAWEDIKPSLFDAVKKRNSVLFIAEDKNKNALGAIWTAKGGGMLSYIMGGVNRTGKDLKLGHLLQWRCMLEAISLGYSQYNISVGGSDGVVRFKNSFYPVVKYTDGPQFHVLNRTKYLVFKGIFPFFERNKVFASKILKLIR